MQNRPTLKEMALLAGVNGWECPRCGCEDWRVADSRWTGDGQRVRKRVCRHCHYVFTSLEVPVQPQPESGD